jgi:chromate transporter
MDVLELFYSFAKVGLFGFGGGPSMIPLIQIEVVEVQGWLSTEEFWDAFGFGNALPGPIATKMAGYVGYQVAGVAGAAAGLIGVTVPTIIAMIALASFYSRFRDHAAMKSFLRGVRPVVIALLLLVAWDFAPSALGAASPLPAWPLWLLALLAFVLTIRFELHPALLIVLGGLAGIFFL